MVILPLEISSCSDLDSSSCVRVSRLISSSFARRSCSNVAASCDCSCRSCSRSFAMRAALASRSEACFCSLLFGGFSLTGFLVQVLLEPSQLLLQLGGCFLCGLKFGERLRVGSRAYASHHRHGTQHGQCGGPEWHGAINRNSSHSFLLSMMANRISQRGASSMPNDSDRRVKRTANLSWSWRNNCRLACEVKQGDWTMVPQ